MLCACVCFPVVIADQFYGIVAIEVSGDVTLMNNSNTYNCVFVDVNIIRVWFALMLSSKYSRAVLLMLSNKYYETDSFANVITLVLLMLAIKYYRDDSLTNAMFKY